MIEVRAVIRSVTRFKAEEDRVAQSKTEWRRVRQSKPVPVMTRLIVRTPDMNVRRPYVNAHGPDMNGSRSAMIVRGHDMIVPEVRMLSANRT